MKPAGETYLRNGIRLSGTPGFQNSLSDAGMWRIAGLLANADKIPESVKNELSRKISSSS